MHLVLLSIDIHFEFMDDDDDPYTGISGALRDIVSSMKNLEINQIIDNTDYRLRYYGNPATTKTLMSLINDLGSVSLRETYLTAVINLKNFDYHNQTRLTEDIGILATYLYDEVIEQFKQLGELPASQEALYRNIVGRFYYAILREAEDVLSVVIDPDLGNEHSQIIECIADPDQQNTVSTMRRLRRKADYDLIVTITVGDAMTQKFDYEDVTGQLA